jgi:phosphonoacetaldehyde hydrolase
MAALVKIGDTAADIEEGRNAGMWTIGITRTGNEIGLTEEEWARVADADRERMLRDAEPNLLDAGAHYTAESVAECDAILDRIEARLAVGERP